MYTLNCQGSEIGQHSRKQQQCSVYRIPAHIEEVACYQKPCVLQGFGQDKVQRYDNWKEEQKLDGVEKHYADLREARDVQEGKQYTGWQSSIYAKPDRQMPVRRMLAAKICREGMQAMPCKPQGLPDHEIPDQRSQQKPVDSKRHKGHAAYKGNKGLDGQQG